MNETQKHPEWGKIQEYMLDDFSYVEQQNNPVTEADPWGWELAETN